MKSWYLLYCKRGEQSRAKMHLENQQVECYYPEVEIEKILRGKKQLVLEPLFPNYVFIRFDSEIGPSFTTIRSTRGVVDFIRFGGLPSVVPDELIVQLRQIEYEQDQQQQTQLPAIGQSVHIKQGQFSGVEAIYQESDGEKRSILLITLINKQVKVKVDNKDIEW